MNDSRSDSAYRLVFTLADAYNLTFGLWAVLWPGGFFALFDLDSPQYLGIWSFLGMVIGLCGLLYIYAGRRLEQAGPIITVGLLGKLMGPCGVLVAVLGGEFPARIGGLLLFNDVIWWIPLGAFLVRLRRRA